MANDRIDVIFGAILRKLGCALPLRYPYPNCYRNLLTKPDKQAPTERQRESVQRMKTLRGAAVGAQLPPTPLLERRG
jgi:hypothetical protein